MRTTKPISTVTYNTPAYLRIKLDELVSSKKISFWAFISHKPEDDEKKQHIHLYAEPSKMIQTDDLRDFLKEVDLHNPAKPLTSISWRGSKFDDWYLYSLHDVRYLASKGQSRKYHYTRDNIITSDLDDLDDHIQRIDMLSLTPYEVVREAVEQGKSFEALVSTGRVPIQQIRNFQLAFEALQSVLKRTHKTHTPAEPDSSTLTPAEPSKALSVRCSTSDDDFVIYDPETGELIG